MIVIALSQKLGVYWVSDNYCWLISVNSTQSAVTWQEWTSMEESHPLYWSVDKSVGALSWLLIAMREPSQLCVMSHLGKWAIVVQKDRSGSEPVSNIPLWLLPLFLPCFHELPQWWPVIGKWTVYEIEPFLPMLLLDVVFIMGTETS